MKHILSLLLALMLTACPALAEEARTPIDPGEVPDFVPLLLQKAEGELGYEEGPNNFSKYGQWSGDPNAAWCAEFICWCVSQVDEENGTQLLDVIYPNYSGQNTGRDWFIARGRFAYRKGVMPDWGVQWLRDANAPLGKNGYVPRPGDLVFFSYNEAGDTEHVALVEYASRDSEGRVWIHVIEGNNPSSVQRNAYRLDDSQVLGFGLCEDVVDTTMRYGNAGDEVIWLQQSLIDLGYLAKRHLTGTYAANTKSAVADFQRRNLPHLNDNGIADRETQQEIRRQMDALINDSPDTWLVGE